MKYIKDATPSREKGRKEQHGDSQHKMAVTVSTKWALEVQKWRNDSIVQCGVNSTTGLQGVMAL